MKSDARSKPAAKKKPGGKQSAKSPRLSLETVAAMAAKPPALRWDVEGVMVRGQPMVIGGPPKSLKTSLALDLGVSLATATPFLGHFPVPKQRRVAMFSGESGRATVYETVRRVLRARDTEPDDCPLHLGFRLPRLAVPADRTELRRLLTAEGVEVVVVDPVYLCLLAGGRTLSATNLFDVGAVLGAAADACSRAGATLVLVHHTTKGAADRPGPATLADLAFVGVGEFARQWLLVSRAAEYVPGTGRHDLVLSVGGSAGHSSRWRVGVDEGPAGGTEREWTVEVEPDEPRGSVVNTDGPPEAGRSPARGADARVPGDLGGPGAGRVRRPFAGASQPASGVPGAHLTPSYRSGRALGQGRTARTNPLTPASVPVSGGHSSPGWAESVATAARPQKSPRRSRVTRRKRVDWRGRVMDATARCTPGNVVRRRAGKGRRRPAGPPRRGHGMAFETRKAGGRYFYLGVRDRETGKVRKVYLGRGDAARAVAASVADRKGRREADRRAVGEARDALRAVDALTAELDGAVTLLTEAVLLAAGFRRQNYGPWRRKRDGHGRHEPGPAAGRTE